MFDAYNLRARLAPAGLAAMPALVLLGGGLASPTELASIAAMACGGIGIVVAGLARESGRRLQPRLWRSWGGSPTLHRLRWRSGEDTEQLARRHAGLSEVAGFAMPTADEEKTDPLGADARYEEATGLLRNLTRRREMYPLVFAENVEYGFRRNCLGLRPAGLAIALGNAVIGVVLALSADNRFWLAAAVGTIAALWWWRAVTSAWVRRAAELYADQLIGSIEIVRRSDAS
jgi:hypothetical protein